MGFASIEILKTSQSLKPFKCAFQIHINISNAYLEGSLCHSSTIHRRGSSTVKGAKKDHTVSHTLRYTLSSVWNEYI
jgi:hypothetical protein